MGSTRRTGILAFAAQRGREARTGRIRPRTDWRRWPARERSRTLAYKVPRSPPADLLGGGIYKGHACPGADQPALAALEHALMPESRALRNQEEVFGLRGHGRAR